MPAGLLAGQRALVVGAGPGLGRDLAERFAEAGADVAVSARRLGALEEIAAAVRAHGRRTVSLPADVTSQADVDALLCAVERELGGLDALVYNAFVPPPMVPVAEVPDETWTRSFEVHVVGAVRVAKAATRLLSASKGCIVFVNTQAARRHEPRRGPYSATKAAQLSLAATLAGELGPLGIRVNSVVPGHILGPALRAHLEERARRRGTGIDAVYQEVCRPMALRRIPTGPEVAAVAVFFASPMAAAVTGQTLDVNAGNWWA